MNLINLIMSNLFLTFLYNVIKFDLVRHKALYALKNWIFFILRKKNMQTAISVLILRAQLYADNS